MEDEVRAADPVRPEPDPVLTEAIADAARAAIIQLRSEHPGPFCLYALLTTGEAPRPYLAVTPDGPGRWDLPDSPFAVFGDEHFAPLELLYAARGDLFEMGTETADVEYWVRLVSMEAALRSLDHEELFGTGTERERTLLLVTTMPPDDTDAEFAHRLNPSSELLSPGMKRHRKATWSKAVWNSISAAKANSHTGSSRELVWTRIGR